jgi:hypothetical protein
MLPRRNFNPHRRRGHETQKKNNSHHPLLAARYDDDDDEKERIHITCCLRTHSQWSVSVKIHIYTYIQTACHGP